MQASTTDVLVALNPGVRAWCSGGGRRIGGNERSPMSHVGIVATPTPDKFGQSGNRMRANMPQESAEPTGAF